VDSERSARASKNNFDLIRLLAAIGVLVSHAFSLAGAGEPMIAGVTVGTLGVYVFFVISGYLILKSWTFDPRVSAFLVKRCLRIFPGLLGAVLFTALVVGPLSTSHTLSSYFTDPQTAQFIGGALVLFAPQGTLPGVFAHNPFGGVINGSLWSLTYEFALYLMVVYFGRLLRWHAGKAFALGLFVLAAGCEGVHRPVAAVPVVIHLLRNRRPGAAGHLFRRRHGAVRVSRQRSAAG
jgi:peptidoglycan/LPS O-acetylase OafA/YrhL